MSNPEEILDIEVSKARELMPFRSDIVSPGAAPAYGYFFGDSREDSARVAITETHTLLDKERSEVVKALRNNYGGDFITWFCEQVDSRESPPETRPHLVIVNDLILPKRDNRILTVAGLAVVVALYDLDDDQYRKLPNALLVTSRDETYEAFTNASLAMNRRSEPTDFAIM